MASLRVDVDVIIDTRVPDPEAAPMNLAEDIVLAAFV